jgi:DNA-binding CsgD family transcriptional regulator
VSRVFSARIVGRTAELSLLDSAYARAATGELAFVLLSGEAGIGKTRLVREHAARVHARGGLVLVGESIQLGDVSLPYGPFLDALGPGKRGMPPGVAIDWAAADPVGSQRRAGTAGPADGLGAQAALFASVVGALDQLAREQPVLLVLEDLHWADPASRDLLGYLVRRLRGSAIEVIATFRSDVLHRRHPLLPFLAEADRWPFTERIEIGRLDVHAVSELVGELVGEPLGRAAVERLFARSDGIPFFVESILAEQTAGPGRGGGAPGQLLGASTAALSPVARRVLGAAAVLGRRPVHDLLLEIAGEPPRVVLAALHECTDALLLLPSQVGSDAAYEFRHALLQEAAYDELLPAERTALHRRVATTLADGVDFTVDVPVALAGEIAHHADRAHDLPLALRAAEAAGRAATSALAFTDADGHFAHALELWSQVHGDEAGRELATLIGRAANAAGYANQPARAARYDRRRLELASPVDAGAIAAILHELFWHLWDAGELGDLVPTAERALALVAPEPPSPARAIALADLGFARWSICENEMAEELAREAVLVAGAVGDVVEGTALLVLANATAGLGRTRTADTLFAEASDRLRASRDCDGAARIAHWWANALEFDGAYERAVWVAEEGLVAARRAGVDIRHGDAIRAVLAENLEHLGLWDEALAIAADGFNWGSGQPSEIWSHAVHARIAICRGQLDGARRQLDATEGVQAAGPDRVWQAEELMSLAYAVRDLDRARAYLAEGIAASPTPEREMALWWLLVRALEAETEIAVGARATGDAAGLAAAERHARRCADLLDANAAAAIGDGGEGPLIRALAAWSVALRSRLDGRSDPEAWATTVRQLEEIGTVWYTALARCRLAEALILGGAGAGEVAPVLARARETGLALATPPLLEEVGRLARVAGIELDDGEEARAGNGDEAAAARDPFGLSPREIEVLALLAAGRTNREIGEELFISPKTASVHVTHILAKLGVSSRVEAALAGSRAGIVGGGPGGAAG